MRSWRRFFFSSASAATVLLFVAVLPVRAQGIWADSTRIKDITFAVDAKGVRHRGTEYKGGPPWLKECVKGPSFYPYQARHLHQQGIAIVRVTLNLATGEIEEATIAKSSGFPVLDNGALKTIHGWRWPPGKWKEVIVPIEFTMGKAPGPEQPMTGRRPNK